jgi:hypothetical protein
MGSALRSWLVGFTGSKIGEVMAHGAIVRRLKLMGSLRCPARRPSARKPCSHTLYHKTSGIPICGIEPPQDPMRMFTPRAERSTWGRLRWQRFAGPCDEGVVAARQLLQSRNRTWDDNVLA